MIAASKTSNTLRVYAGAHAPTKIRPTGVISYPGSTGESDRKLDIAYRGSVMSSPFLILVDYKIGLYIMVRILGVLMCVAVHFLTM